MNDAERLAQINDLVEHELGIKNKEDTPRNRIEALQSVKKTVEKMQNQLERERYLHLIEIELVRIGAKVETERFLFDRGRNVYSIAASMRYDMEEGELHVDGMLNEVVHVRKSMMDAVLRQAMIVELERLGYTVISPKQL